MRYADLADLGSLERGAVSKARKSKYHTAGSKALKTIQFKFLRLPLVSALVLFVITLGFAVSASAVESCDFNDTSDFAVVDGDPNTTVGTWTEWGDPPNAACSALLYESNNPNKVGAFTAYLRYHCPTSTMYVLVLDDLDDGINVQNNEQDAWVRVAEISSSTIVDLTSSYNNNGTPTFYPPESAWVPPNGVQGVDLEGFEASFPIDPGTYTIDVHLNGYSTAPGQGNTYQNTFEVSIDCTTITAAIISSVSAFTDGSHYGVEWVTASEVGTLGFHIERLDKKNGRYERINKRLLPAMPVSQGGGTYRFADKTADPNGINVYRIVEREIRGGTHVYGPYQLEFSKAAMIDQADHYTSSAKEVKFSKLISSEGDSLSRRPHKKQNLKAWKDPLKLDSPGETNVSRSMATEAADPASAVKIAVTQDGMHQVSAADISAVSGWSAETVRDNIHSGSAGLKHQGQEVRYQPVDDKGSALVFYGNGIRSIHTKDNIYTFTLASSGGDQIMDKVNGGNPSAPQVIDDAFTSVVAFEEDVFYAPMYYNNPDAQYWLWTGILSGWSEADGSMNYGEEEVEFITHDPHDRGKSILELVLKGGSEPTNHDLAIEVNGTLIGNVFFHNLMEHTAQLKFENHLLKDGSNTLTLRALETSGDGSRVFLDRMTLSYQRLFEAADDQLVFKAGEDPQVVSIGGFSLPNIVAYDISDPYRVKWVYNITVDDAGGEYRASFKPSNPRTQYLMTTAEAILQLGVDRLTADTPSQLKHVRNKSEYIVITPDAFTDAAQQLADYRRSLNLSSKLVKLSDIYDEFNYGIVHPEAIRDFLSYAWHNWKRPPRFAVLCGEGTYDHRDIYKNGDSHLPILVGPTSYGLFAADNRYGDVDGSNDNRAEIAVGRLPAATLAELQDVIDKIIAYENSAFGDGATRVLMTADKYDGEHDFWADSDELAQFIKWPRYQTQKIYLNEDNRDEAHTQLINALNEGRLLMNYIGHASYDSFSSKGLLTKNDLSELVAGHPLPVIAGLTCLVNYFEWSGLDSIGEEFVLAPDNGAAAVWAPTGMSFNIVAKRLGEEFFKSIFKNRQKVLGQAILDAQRNVPAELGDGFAENTFMLMGDPGMQLK
jgi:hypothetical protein